jgi:hypothetical protein
VERTVLGLWVSVGSLFERRLCLRVHRLGKRADLFGNCCGCRFHTEASGDRKQQERLSRDHVESDARGDGCDERTAFYYVYYEHLDDDDHDNSDDDHHYDIC